MIVRICVLYLVIIIHSEVWIISHCLMLGLLAILVTIDIVFYAYLFEWKVCFCFLRKKTFKANTAGRDTLKSSIFKNIKNMWNSHWPLYKMSLNRCIHIKPVYWKQMVNAIYRLHAFEIASTATEITKGLVYNMLVAHVNRNCSL